MRGFILQAIVKIRFPVYSGWCTDGAFRVLENIIINNNRWFKICDKGDDTPAPSPESKIDATFILQLENIIVNNNRWFKICDKGDDTPAPSPESKNYATFILQVRS
nr:unnamed protein product [Callosobruchus analis]